MLRRWSPTEKIPSSTKEILHQIHCILHTGLEALSTFRGMHMCGVAAEGPVCRVVLKRHSRTHVVLSQARIDQWIQSSLVKPKTRCLRPIRD